MTADLIVSGGTPQGTIAMLGNRDNGFALYVQDGRVVFETVAGNQVSRLVSSRPLPAGRVAVTFRFDRKRSPDEEKKMPMAGMGHIFINKQSVAESWLPSVQFTHWGGSIALYIGRPGGGTVSAKHGATIPFTDQLEQLSITLKPD